jgi:hypothetical protein
MIRTRSVGLPAASDPALSELPVSAAAAADPKPPAQRNLVFAVHEQPRLVTFVEGAVIKGTAFEVFAILARQFRQDLEIGVPLDNRPYVPSNRIADELKITSDVLRQRVLRMRRSIELQFQNLTGYCRDREDVVQSINWTGYRLNPYLIETDVRQVPQRPILSRSASAHVTSQRATA